MNKAAYLIIVVVALGLIYYIIPEQESKAETKTDIQVETLEEGIELARKENKLVFLYINSESCSYCRILEKQFAESEEFQKIIDQYYIWVTLDFQRNPAIVARFRLQGSPAMIIIDQNDEPVFGIPGYPPRGVVDVIAMLKEAVK
jgi:thioredoxin 1